MSHVATLDLEIKDLDALEEACKRLGMELVRGQQTYRCWYTSFDDPAEREQAMSQIGVTVDRLMPEGFTGDEIGKCEHAIRVRGRERAYEIGIVRRRDGRPGYTLLLDEWRYDEGEALSKAVGRRGSALKREYAAVVATRAAQRQGFRVNEQRRADGSIQLRLSR